MLAIIIIIVLSTLAQLVLPWWVIAPVSFIVCWQMSKSGRQAFWSGFLGIAVVWLVYAIWIHLRTDGVLSGRMSQLLFKTDGPLILWMITAMIGGLVGGLAGAAGYQFRQTLR